MVRFEGPVRDRRGSCIAAFPCQEHPETAVRGAPRARPHGGTGLCSGHPAVAHDRTQGKNDLAPSQSEIRYGLLSSSAAQVAQPEGARTACETMKASTCARRSSYAITNQGTFRAAALPLLVHPHHNVLRKSLCLTNSFMQHKQFEAAQLKWSPRLPIFFPSRSDPNRLIPLAPPCATFKNCQCSPVRTNSGAAGALFQSLKVNSTVLTSAELPAVRRSLQPIAMRASPTMPLPTGMKSDHNNLAAEAYTRRSLLGGKSVPR